MTSAADIPYHNSFLVFLWSPSASILFDFLLAFVLIALNDLILWTFADHIIFRVKRLIFVWVWSFVTVWFLSSSVRWSMWKVWLIWLELGLPAFIGDNDLDLISTSCVLSNFLLKNSDFAWYFFDSIKFEFHFEETF